MPGRAVAATICNLAEHGGHAFTAAAVDRGNKVGGSGVRLGSGETTNVGAFDRLRKLRMRLLTTVSPA